MSKKRRLKLPQNHTPKISILESKEIGEIGVNDECKKEYLHGDSPQKVLMFFLLKICVEIFDSIGLIFRRTLASTINSLIALCVILFVSYIIACFLFFMQLGNYIGFKLFYVVFAVLYGTFGNMGWYTIPPIGGRVTGIQLRGDRSVIYKFFQYLARNMIYILFPVMIIFLSPRLYDLIKSENRGLFYVALTIGLFFMFFSMLIIPLSIVVGKGKQGIHDKICGLVLCRKNDNEVQGLSWKYLLYKSSLFSLLVSLVMTMACHAWFFGFDFDKLLFPGEDRKKYFTEIEAISNKIEKNYKAESFKNKKYDVTDGLIWWVDLEPNTNERINAAKEIGLKDVNALDLLGYGVKMYDTNNLIELIDLKREKTKILPEKSRIFSVFIFVDDRIFYQRELASFIMDYFVDKTLDMDLAQNSDALRVKVVNLVKVGIVKLGAFDEYYITPRKINHGIDIWRSKEAINYPSLIFYIGTSGKFGSVYIDESDFK